MAPISRRLSAGLLTLLALVGVAIAMHVIQTQQLARVPVFIGIIFPLVYAGLVLGYLKRYYHDPNADTLLWTVAAASYLITLFYILAAFGMIWAQEASGGEIVDEFTLVIESGLGGSILGLVIGHIHGQSVIARGKLGERQRQLENQIQRLDEFVNVVSHDLRNPLNVAEGRLELAAEQCKSEHLDAVDRALDRMGALIDDMLSLASAGRDVGAVEPVELSELLAGCWATVETEAAELVTNTTATVQADETRLQQLVENLLRNAVEHGGSEVTIEVGDLPDGFYMEDDGPGIPEEEREEVLDAGYSSNEGGTGFGLSIVRDIAQAHGWQIHITEGSAGGARFEFRGVETGF